MLLPIIKNIMDTKHTSKEYPKSLHNIFILITTKQHLTIDTGLLKTYVKGNR